MIRVIRVGVVGGAGRMGREVCLAVRNAPDLALAAVVDPAAEVDGGPALRAEVGEGPVVSGRPEVKHSGVSPVSPWAAHLARGRPSPFAVQPRL